MHNNYETILVSQSLYVLTQTFKHSITGARDAHDTITHTLELNLIESEKILLRSKLCHGL